MANLSYCLSTVFLWHFIRLVLSLYISLLSGKPKSCFYFDATVNWTSGKKIEDLQLSWKFILDVFVFLSSQCTAVSSFVFCSALLHWENTGWTFHFANQTKYTYCILLRLNFNILFQLRVSLCVCVYVPKIFARATWSESMLLCTNVFGESVICVCVCLVCLIGLVSPLYRRVVDSIFNNVRQTIRSAFRFHRHLCLFVFMFLKLNFISTFSHYLLLMNVPLQSSIPLPF